MGDVSTIIPASSPSFPDKSTLGLEDGMRISFPGSFGWGGGGSGEGGGGSRCFHRGCCCFSNANRFSFPSWVAGVGFPESHVPAHSLLTENLAQAQPLLSLSPSGPLEWETDKMAQAQLLCLLHLQEILSLQYRLWKCSLESH